MAHDGMAAAEEDNIDAWSTEDDDYEDETSSDDEFEDDETSSDGIGCPTEGADQARVHHSREDGADEDDVEDAGDIVGDGEARSRCGDALRVFDCMNEHNFTLGSFLEVVYWGDPVSRRNPQIQRLRTGFMNSAHFRRLLRTWYSPPRSPNSKKSRPSGGRKILHKYISEAINEIFEDELNSLDPILRATEDLLTKEDLTAIRIDSLEEQMRTRTPTLWRILEGASTSKKQRKSKNKHKNPRQVRQYHSSGEK